MADRRERELLLGIFLMEAWDTAGALEDGLGLLAGPDAPAVSALEALLVFAHRLKGSAALHGFPGVSDLAAATERLLDRAPTAGVEDRARAATFVDGLVSLLKEVFDGISAVGVEDAARIGEFKSRYPTFFAAAQPVSLPPLAPAPAVTTDVPAGTPDVPAGTPIGPAATSSMAVELNRFFSDSGEVLEYFLPEATEHLEAMTTALMALEAGARDDETLATLFRSVHTLKGAAYTVGCVPVGDTAHQIEDVLGAARDQRLALSPAIMEAVFAGTAAIKRILQSGGVVGDETALALELATRDLRALTISQEAGRPEPVMSAPSEATSTVALAEAPAAQLDVTGFAALPLPGFVRPEFLARLEALPRPAPRSASAPTGPSIRVPVERLDALMNLVGELMIARSRLDQRLAQLDRVSELLLASRTRLGQVGRDFEFRRQTSGMSAGPSYERASPEHDDVAGLRDISEIFAELEFDRYDDVNILARSVAEMSADVAEVQSQHVALLRSIREDTAHVQRLTAALRREITRARMVPIGRLFTRVAQQMREAARATGKTVNLSVHGEGAEVDTGVIEQIADPLLHLIQNAVAHGIEPSAEREGAGKPAQGQVTLSAAQEGGFILVQVEDDGRGIDASLLRRQAVERGLLPAAEAAALSDRDALNLIFVPGFSTAAAVTRTSGRGVGLDVVRTNVSRLNGEIHVETEPGRVTRFVLRLPLTVAIADALMVRCGGAIFAFPLSAVSVMRPVASHEIARTGGREAVRVDDRAIDLIRLDRVLGLTASPPPVRLPVVVLRGGGKPFGAVVDELLGKEEIVIKPLGAFLEGVGPFSGATISGEGRVILLLDPTLLREAATRPLPEVPSDLVRTGETVEQRPRVLLVDDSVSIRKFVGQMLEKAGFQVFTAVDGHDALQQLVDLTVDVIVTDLEMPRVNGYALIEDLRRRSATREVPVIVLTTRAGGKHVDLARRLGVSHYVTKPVDERRFVRLVESVATTFAVVEPALAGSGRAGATE
ncbi:MAG TPA: Hpt domain-containing protein [Methylomirabilota bacterium]|nr:Hpt domain-containing protein [Methylomirabilota bacterium]